MAMGIFEQLASLTTKVKRLCCWVEDLANQLAGYRLTDFAVRDMSIPSTGIVINEIPNGAITDGVLPNTKGGAMTTATISKVGNYDKLAVTGGNQGSFIYFNNVWIVDNGVNVKLSVRVENLNKDGATGTSYLGIAFYGLNFTWDTGTGWNIAGVGELVGKGIGFYNYLNNYTAGDTYKASAGTLVSSGDILDVELKFNVFTQGSVFEIKNRTTGEYISAIKLATGGFNFGWVRNQFNKTCRLGLIASNADYTILDYKVYSDVSKPLAAFIGDNTISGYNFDYSTSSLLPKLNALSPYQFSMYCANGANINNMAQVMVREALKLRPKYTFFIAANLRDGRFLNTSPDYTAWYTAFTNMINEVIVKQSIPVLSKLPTGGQGGANYTTWNTFVDQQVLLFPQIKVLDMSSLIFLWDDSFSIPGPTDFTQMANAINNFLIAEGY
jgi:hypothetical protein